MRYSVLAVIVGLVALAGCGGSDSDGGSSTGPAAPPAQTQRTSDDFAAQVDAACEDTRPQLAETMAALTKARDAARAGQVSSSKTFKTFATLLRRASATTKRFVTRLRAIDVPSSERAFHDALIGSVQEGAANLRLQVSAAEAQDATRLRELSIAGSVLNAKSKGVIAGHGGLRFCGRR